MLKEEIILNCKNCGLPIEPQALYCGNCGLKQAKNKRRFFKRQKKNQTTPLTPLPIPDYAVNKIHVHNLLKVIIALILGMIGILGSFFMAAIGIILGFVGLIIYSTANVIYGGRLFKYFVFVIDMAAILTGLAIWVSLASSNYHIIHTKYNYLASHSITNVSVTTPCYQLTFSKQINIQNITGSCDLAAYNGLTLVKSNNIYKVFAISSSVINNYKMKNFKLLAKSSLETYIKNNFPGFIIVSTSSGLFAGQQAYYINAQNLSLKETIVEAMVSHNSKSGTKLFIVLHLSNTQNNSLASIEQSWQWE